MISSFVNKFSLTDSRVPLTPDSFVNVNWSAVYFILFFYLFRNKSMSRDRSTVTPLSQACITAAKLNRERNKSVLNVIMFSLFTSNISLVQTSHSLMIHLGGIEYVGSEDPLCGCRTKLTGILIKVCLFVSLCCCSKGGSVDSHLNVVLLALKPLTGRRPRW